MSDENMDNSDEGKFSFSLFVFAYVYKLIYFVYKTIKRIW